jgi:hypothetical protein
MFDKGLGLCAGEEKHELSRQGSRIGCSGGFGAVA